MKIGVDLFPNLDHETKQIEQEHDMCETIIQQKFITTKK
jgi:hypothetical protein